MPTYIDWCLFHKVEDIEPTSFIEVRRYKNLLWMSRGRVLTFGTASLQKLESEALALERFSQIRSNAQGEGFTISAEGQEKPGEFDFSALRDSVKVSAERCLEIIYKRHPGQTLCAFGLLTDDDAMTIGPVCNSLEAIESSKYKEEATYNLSAWAFRDGEAWFDVPYRLLLRQHQNIPFDQNLDHHVFKRNAFNSFVDALQELREEGCFSDFGRDFALLVQVSDADQISGMLTRLNSDPSFLSGYREFMGE